MKTAGEIIRHLNETGENVYDLSESLGLYRTTLRGRLIKLGYKMDEEGCWSYEGDSDDGSFNVDIVTKKRLTNMKQANNTAAMTFKSSYTKPNIHEALMQLDLDPKRIRTTISIQHEYLEGIKGLAARTRLRLSDLYTLAIFELLEKYHSED